MEVEDKMKTRSLFSSSLVKFDKLNKLISPRGNANNSTGNDTDKEHLINEAQRDIADTLNHHLIQIGGDKQVNYQSRYI